MEEFSAGGVVVHEGRVLVVVPVRRDDRGQRVLALPKGHPEPGESAEQAAIREVREETGTEVELIEPVGEIRYAYDHRGRRRDKRVGFFLFLYCSGSLQDHDHEIEEARWMAIEQAERELTYPGERDIVARARSLIGVDR